MKPVAFHSTREKCFSLVILRIGRFHLNSLQFVLYSFVQFSLRYTHLYFALLWIRKKAFRNIDSELSNTKRTTKASNDGEREKRRSRSKTSDQFKVRKRSDCGSLISVYFVIPARERSREAPNMV